MAWRIVEQPNGLLARFSDIVDDFTHYDMTDEQAEKLCIEEYDMGKKSAAEKVRRGRADKSRWPDEIDTIRMVHGDAVANERIMQLSAAVQAV